MTAITWTRHPDNIDFWYGSTPAKHQKFIIAKAELLYYLQGSFDQKPQPIGQGFPTLEQAQRAALAHA